MVTIYMPGTEFVFEIDKILKSKSTDCFTVCKKERYVALLKTHCDVMQYMRE